MEWTSIATIVGATAAVVGLATTWLSGKFNTMDADIKGITKRMDQKSDELHQRVDSANARIDTTQAILMRMVEKLGK